MVGFGGLRVKMIEIITGRSTDARQNSRPIVAGGFIICFDKSIWP
jgi:hypothetical protein